MAITAYPFDSQDVSETQFSEMFKELQQSGVVGDPASTGFKLSTDGSGLDVQVAPGFAFVRGHVVKSTASETRTLAAAETQPRIDRLVLRLDPSLNSITLVVLKGTASTSPVAPSLATTDSGIFELLLGEVRVESGSLNITASNITDLRTFAGSTVTPWTATTRPAAPRVGRLGFNSTSGKWEYWNGSAWIDLVAPVAPKTVRVPHTFTISGEVKIATGDLHFIPPFFVPVPPGQTVKLVGVRYLLNSGTGTTFTILRNGASVAGLSGLSATPTATSASASLDLAHNDLLALRIDSLSGTPKNLSVTVQLDYTV